MGKQTVISGIQTALSIVGTLDAGTVYWAHRAGASLPCTSGGGCDVVNNSPWAFITFFSHQIPVSLCGALTYLVLLIASVLRLTGDSELAARRLNGSMLVISFLGTCYSWYLQYVAKFLIGEFCIYCRVSAFTMTLIFLASFAAAVFYASRRPPALAEPKTEGLPSLGRSPTK